MAVDRNERVMEMVEEAIRENPDVSNQELQERASVIDPRIGELSPRSFNARYPLQVKRRMSVVESERKQRSKREAASEEFRAVVRQALLDFAKEIIGPDDRGRMIDALREVDEYVNKVLAAR